jgi:AcrR family transcriptional regulator
MGRSSESDKAVKLAGRGAYHHGDLRNALLAAAADLLEERGPEGLSLRKIARRCDVSQTAPYRHFATREALLVALAADAFRAFAARLSQEAAGAAGPAARLCALGRGYVAFALENPEKLRLMFGPQSPEKDASEDLAEAARAAFTLVEGATAACLAEPGTRRDIDLGAATLGAWAVVHGLAHLAIDMPLPDDLVDVARRNDLVDRLMTVYIDGLAAP